MEIKRVWYYKEKNLVKKNNSIWCWSQELSQQTYGSWRNSSSIIIYNEKRLYLSLGMKTPNFVHKQRNRVNPDFFELNKRELSLSDLLTELKVLVFNKPSKTIAAF